MRHSLFRRRKYRLFVRHPQLFAKEKNSSKTHQKGSRIVANKLIVIGFIGAVNMYQITRQNDEKSVVRLQFTQVFI